jgi:hypothetical protein
LVMPGIKRGATPPMVGDIAGIEIPAAQQSHFTAAIFRRTRATRGDPLPPK